MRNRFFAHARGLAAAALVALAMLAAAAQRPLSAQELQPLVIVTDEGRHDFQVELAATPEERARGLMFRRSMPQDQGMLFDFQRVQPLAMWMRNTYISLDMLFIDADGTIVRIAQNTEPLSERTIPSGQPVLSVLELNGGVTSRLGIEPGDRVEHPLFAE
ncbi:DUF192 domain-containing protein [Salinarimonas ramus]|uniref:DUF192 domain-containing protein n=1 Tax=Salinarimonas ramus TaxID=690164 RepID=A0A917Q408_9HYPH|nr:DUF192 domain-containing protein [Salinarimonas ramus]GGK18320.1 hypothetical protein GCM10011322_01320 [Salinarimonas ramus]